MNNTFNERVSKRIKDLRTKHGYTMEQLAEKVGVSKSTIAKWENGYVDNMRQEKIFKLAVIFGVTPAYISGYSEETETIPNLDDRSRRMLAYYLALTDSNKDVIDATIKALSDK